MLPLFSVCHVVWFTVSSKKNGRIYFPFWLVWETANIRPPCCCRFAQRLRKFGFKWEECWSVLPRLFWVNNRSAFTTASFYACTQRPQVSKNRLESHRVTCLCMVNVCCRRWQFYTAEGVRQKYKICLKVIQMSKDDNNQMATAPYYTQIQYIQIVKAFNLATQIFNPLYSQLLFRWQYRYFHVWK